MVSLCCRLGFSVLIYGLGSKKALLEDFRVTHLAQDVHMVVNGFFPSITLKSVSVKNLFFKVGTRLKLKQLEPLMNCFLFQILNSLTCEVLEHEGSFRTLSDQILFISNTLKESQSSHCSLKVLTLFVSERF